MHIIDWIIVLIPIILVVSICLYTQRYVTGVSDFLAARRVAGRYVVAVSQGEAATGLISIVAILERYYASGFAIGFWTSLIAPVGLLFTLTGFLVYRYRETRAMTMGQLFEIRYSKSFRIFSGILQSISGIVNYGLFPAVGARFLVYFLDLPQHIEFLGYMWPTFALLMAFFLTTAVIIACMGGQLTIMTSDCVMGILSYPMYLAVVVSIFYGFSWWGEITPSLMDRAPGESMLNPFDTHNLRDFNLFFVFVGMMGSIYSMMSWSGTQGYNAAARNAHEQKMGKILGTWRSGFQGLMIILLAVAGYTYYNHENFSEQAGQTANRLSWMALEDTALKYAPEGAAENKNDPEFIAKWQERIAEEDPAVRQTYETIYKQMRVPVALSEILPIGILGVFCAAMIFAMLSTDTTYLHSWGSIVVQDVILPFRKKAFTPRQHLFLLRLILALVAVYAFFFSLYFGQMTYILMFFALTGSIYLGGAGSVIIGGLYWKKGTTAGAYGAMITGSGLALLGFIFMNYWVGAIYPFLQGHPQLLALTTTVVEAISSPFEPIILWRVTGEKFFMNGQEVYFLTMISSITMYISLSLLTCKENFNMDRMLHRGEYAITDEQKSKAPPKPAGFKSFKDIMKALTGIDSQFTRGDRVISYSVLIYTLVWVFGSWLVIVVWNAISGWSDTYWVWWFFIQNVIVASLIGLVSTFWFSIGGSIDLYHMFKRLRIEKSSVLDDGRVIGHMNVDDLAAFEKKGLIRTEDPEKKENK